MKKIFICFLLVFVSFILASCEDNESNTQNTPTNGGNEDSYIVPDYSGGNMDYSNIGYVEGSIHQYNMTETNDYVIQNGSTLPFYVRYFRADKDHSWTGYKNYTVIDNVYFGYFENGNH